MKQLITSLLVAIFIVTACSQPSSTQLKPRLVVLTDIGDCDVEPDDMESAVRLLAYADRFEIEGIMTSIGWNCDPYPEDWVEYLNTVVDAYGEDVRNLMARSGQTSFRSLSQENGKQELGYWPSYEYIKSRCMAGSHRAGIGVIGADNDTPGSEFLIKLADEDDDRPIWVAAWGGGNTLAQAIWKVKQTRSPEELKAFVRKFRIYTISDQDMVYAMRFNREYSSHMWLRTEFQDDLQFIWDEGAWQLQCELGKQYWDRHISDIQGHGAMGSVYPDYKWGVEGDTPSFLYVMPNGLVDPEDPTHAGWGGYHKWGISPDRKTYAWNSWEQPQKSISEGYFERFYPDMLNDFAARMQWAAEGKGNTNPVVIINGQDGIAPIHICASAGKKVKLDGSKSKDREGDQLSFKWWHQPEAGDYSNPVEIDRSDASVAFVSVPSDANGKSLHIVCEVHDDGAFNLVSYRRIIIDVQ